MPTIYRVDLWLTGPQCWSEYTSLKRGVTLEMARALATSLRRAKATARIVNIKTNEEVSQ